VALLAGPLDEAGEERAAEAVALPFVSNGRGELDDARLAGNLDIADHCDTVTRARIDREQSLAIVMINVK
jgi:hypothetical protein